MGIFSKLNIFKKKEKPVEDIEAEISKMKSPTAMEPSAENIHAKMDLVATKLESLGVKYDTLNSRLDRIEKILNEIYAIAKQ